MLRAEKNDMLETTLASLREWAFREGSDEDPLAIEVGALVKEVDRLRTALVDVDNHLRAIIVYAKSGSELEATANDARKLIVRMGVSVQP